MRRHILLVSALLTACSAGPQRTDAAVQDASVTPDAAVDAGVDSGSSGLNDAGSFSEGTFGLRDGGSLRGLVAARYDHSQWWWSPSSEVTWAVLQQNLKVSFVSSFDVTQVPLVATIPQPEVYALTRDAGLLLSLPLKGQSYVITGHDSYHLQEDGYGDSAWDFVRSDEDAGRFSGAGTQNADFKVWNEPVYLPASGTVIEVVADAEDNVPGAYDAGAVNNLIGVRINGNWAVYLLHFQKNSIPTRATGTCEPDVAGVTCIEPGAFLDAGTYVGRVGNSGVTLEPHLHLTMHSLDPVTQRAWSVPSEFKNVYQRRAGEGAASFATTLVPTRGMWVAQEPF